MILDGHFKKPIFLSYIRFWGENKRKISGPSWWRIRKNWKSHIIFLTGMKRSGMKGGLHSLQSSILFLTEKRGRRSMAREDDICFFWSNYRKNLGLHWRDWQACADRGDSSSQKLSLLTHFLFILIYTNFGKFYPNFLRLIYYI